MAPLRIVLRSFFLDVLLLKVKVDWWMTTWSVTALWNDATVCRLLEM